tara:strand:+ start:885 stop:1340 length:456 start_codon:yes stop_codon:yes gene_type:complete
MSEYEKIEMLKEKLQQQLNFIMKQKKVMETYKKRTNEEINKLRHDNKKIIERYMKIDRPIHFTIQRPMARKCIRRSQSDSTDTIPRVNKMYVKELEARVTQLHLEKEREKSKYVRQISINKELLKKFDDKQKNKMKDYMSRNYLCNEYIVG